MYGTLGYIDNGKRPVARDSQFMGTSGNPARRDMYGARRPDPATTVASNNLALLERRCVFLEEQEKRRASEVADLRVKLAEAHVEAVRATVLEPTVQTTETEPVVGISAEVAAGTEVQLQYPMKRVRSGEATQVWMRRREVDPHLAAVTYSWLLLFEEREAHPDRVLVGDFR